MTLRMNNEKRKKWGLLAKKFSGTGDKLGKGIDKKILETVVALNALGINTDQSCEGHLKWGTCSPWVDIKATNTEKLEAETLKSWEDADMAAKSGICRETTDKLFGQYHQMRIKLKTRNLSTPIKLWPHLLEFYKRRNPEFGTRLTLSFYGNCVGRLQSQGAEFQETLPIKRRKENLLKFQKEMKEFTDYLKEKYFK